MEVIFYKVTADKSARRFKPQDKYTLEFDSLTDLDEYILQNATTSVKKIGQKPTVDVWVFLPGLVWKRRNENGETESLKLYEIVDNEKVLFANYKVDGRRLMTPDETIRWLRALRAKARNYPNSQE